MTAAMLLRLRRGKSRPPCSERAAPTLFAFASPCPSSSSTAAAAAAAGLKGLAAAAAAGDRDMAR